VRIQIAPVAPGLFSALSGSNQKVEPIFGLNATTNEIIFRPVVINPDVEQVFPQLFGTGIRGRSGLGGVTARVGGIEVPVVYTGPQGQFQGLDQANIGPLPGSLKSHPGEKDIELTVDGVRTNVVQVGGF